ncbi:MAG: hypothetical protein HYZ72_16280 [Deltaproteobacteria bacterium]|nr:hypothetical protein [Deltaproteobacteria bacterium]
MEPILIESNYSASDAVRRLAAATSRRRQQRGLAPRLIGDVAQESVVVYRHRPFSRNVIYPRFVGRFVVKDGRTFLEGAMTRTTSFIVGGAIWCGLLVIIGVRLLVALLFDGAGWRGVVGLFVVLAMGGLYWGFTRLVAANAAIDADFLRSDLERVLGEHGV